MTHSGGAPPPGGLSVWAELPAPVSNALAATCERHGVRVSILCNATAQPYLRDCQRFVASAAPQAPTGNAGAGAPVITQVPGLPLTLTGSGLNTGGQPVIFAAEQE